MGAEDAHIVSETADDMEVDSGSVVVIPEADDTPLAPPSALEAARTEVAEGSSTDTDDSDAAEEARQQAILTARDQKTGKFKKQTASERRAELQAQIHEETRRKHDARREREQEERELQRIRAERQALTTPAAPEKPAAPSTKPTWKAFEAEGKSWEDYEDARDSWVKAEAKREALEAVQQQQHETQRTQADRQASDSYARKMTAARQAHPDFDTVLQAAGDLDAHLFVQKAIEFSPQGGELLYALASPQYRQHADALNDLFASIPQAEATYPLMDALLASSDPVKLVLAYAEHADEIQTIVRLPARPALVALGRFETRYVEGAKTGSPSPATPKQTAAPPPSHRAGSRPASAPRSVLDLPPDDYVKHRLEEERQKKAARFA
jgi:hypothetical protein